MSEVRADAPTADAIVRLASQRDAEAWRLLVERHGSAMYRAALRVTRDQHLAADACQEAFLQVRDGARGFVPDRDDAEAAARGWLVRVAALTAMMLVRGAQRRSRREQPGLLQDTRAAEEPRSPPALAEALDQEIAGLPAKHREPLVLHFYGGLDYHTIAATLGTTPGSARVRVHRGLARLRERLDRRGAGAALRTTDDAATAARTPSSAAIAGWIALLDSSAKASIATGVLAGGATFAAYGLAALLAVTVAATFTWALPRPRSVTVAVATAPITAPITPPRANAPIPLADLPVNTWVRRRPTASAAGAFTPLGWNAVVYDPDSRRVVIFDQWSYPGRPNDSYANALLAYDPATDVVAVLKLDHWRPQPVVWADGTPGIVTAPILPANADDPTPVDRQPFGGMAAIPDRHAVLIANGLNEGAIGPTTVVDPGARSDPRILTRHPIDSWLFDLDAGRWTQVARDDRAPNPPNDAGSPAVMTYDSANRVVVLFEQKNGGHAGTETWLFDPVGGRWRQIAQDPSSRSIDTSTAGIAYDSRRGRIVTFGGGYQYGQANPTLAAYSVPGNAWVRLAPCPRAAKGPGFAYDSTHDVFLAVIGAETWIYDPSADAWSRRSATIERSADAVGQSVAYDPALDVFVFAGGTSTDPNWSLFRFAR